MVKDIKKGYKREMAYSAFYISYYFPIFPNFSTDQEPEFYYYLKHITRSLNINYKDSAYTYYENMIFDKFANKDFKKSLNFYYLNNKNRDENGKIIFKVSWF